MANEINSIVIDKGEELLPIGTVVRVDFLGHAVMIYGRKQKKVDEGEELYDYVACPYPQGHISYKSNVFFQHDRIEEVYFKGLETAGEKMFVGIESGD